MRKPVDTLWNKIQCICPPWLFQHIMEFKKHCWCYWETKSTKLDLHWALNAKMIYVQPATPAEYIKLEKKYLYPTGGVLVSISLNSFPFKWVYCNGYSSQICQKYMCAENFCDKLLLILALQLQKLNIL